MSSDVTAGAGEAYAACKTLFEDLNRLATDYCQAIRDTGIKLPKDAEYSRSPNELRMKHNHIWVAHRLEVDKQLLFAATYAIFEQSKRHVKIGSPGRPEVWYALGRGTVPDINLADGVRRRLFMRQELPIYKPPLTIGGTVSYYESKDTSWSVVLIGFELGDVDSPQALKQRVVDPLINAASASSITL